MNRQRRGGKGKNSNNTFEAVMRTKTMLELKCPGVVSCANLLAIAARDLVTMTGALLPALPLPQGRALPLPDLVRR